MVVSCNCRCYPTTRRRMKMASKSKTVFPPTLMPRFSCSVVFTWLEILPWKPFGKVLRNEPAIVCPMSTASSAYWHPHERPDHWQLCGGLRFGLSMGGNVLQVLTKWSPCRQIQASVAYYLPLCVWSVTKSWVIDQPRVHTCPMATDTYTEIGNESILSVISSGERVIPFKPPFPVLMAVCSPNWSSDTEF